MGRYGTTPFLDAVYFFVRPCHVSANRPCGTHLQCGLYPILHLLYSYADSLLCPLPSAVTSSFDGKNCVHSTGSRRDVVRALVTAFWLARREMSWISQRILVIIVGNGVLGYGKGRVKRRTVSTNADVELALQSRSFANTFVDCIMQVNHPCIYT